MSRLADQSVAPSRRCGRGNTQAVNVWAGTGFRNARAATVADIMQTT